MSILTQIITVVEKKILFHHHQHDHHHHHRHHHLREHQIDDNTKMTEPVEDISTITVKKRVFRHPPFNSEFSTIFLVYVRGIPLSTCFFSLFCLHLALICVMQSSFSSSWSSSSSFVVITSILLYSITHCPLLFVSVYTFILFNLVSVLAFTKRQKQSSLSLSLPSTQLP